MIYQNFKIIGRNQTGFAMLEIIIGVAIVGFIGAGLVTTIFQTFSVNDNNSDHMVAIGHVQNAAYWISHDVQMAQNIDLNDDTGTPENEILTLSWVGWERKDTNDNQYIDTVVVCYKHDSIVLTRHQQITTEKYDSYGNFISTSESQEVNVIAQHITAFLAVTEPVNKLTLTISALVDGTQKDYSYEITPRPSS